MTPRLKTTVLTALVLRVIHTNLFLVMALWKFEKSITQTHVYSWQSFLSSFPNQTTVITEQTVYSIYLSSDAMYGILFIESREAMVAFLQRWHPRLRWPKCSQRGVLINCYITVGKISITLSFSPMRWWPSEIWLPIEFLTSLGPPLENHPKDTLGEESWREWCLVYV